MKKKQETLQKENTTKGAVLYMAIEVINKRKSLK
jgi:hypothetical protein